MEAQVLGYCPHCLKLTLHELRGYESKVAYSIEHVCTVCHNTTAREHHFKEETKHDNKP